MATLNMAGSFDFNAETVDVQVTKKSAGNYALGYTNGEGKFVVRYVGNSDADLNEDIKKHIGESEKYKKFKYSYAASPKEAFEKVCQNYHDFGGDKNKLRNVKHPVRPDNTDWTCPVCNKLD